MRLAIIPARGGSRRIPRKNIKLFNGKPMIAYAIDAAKQSNLFEHVVVSTDDVEIARVVHAYGAEVPFMRPAELADDHAATVPVIAHAIRACADLGWTARFVCCIYPSVPLIRVSDLLNACKLLEMGAHDYVFPVTAFPSAIQRALRRLPDGSMTPFYPEYTEYRTQDLEHGYYDAGQFYLGMTEAWLTGKSPHHNGYGLEIPEWRTADIDTVDDWKRAELLVQLIEKTGGDN